MAGSLEGITVSISVEVNGSFVAEIPITNVSSVVGPGVELSLPIAYRVLSDTDGNGTIEPVPGPNGLLNGTVTIDISGNEVFAQFSGQANPANFKVIVSQLQPSGAVAPGTIADAGGFSGVNILNAPTYDVTTKALTFDWILLGFQPGTTVNQTVFYDNQLEDAPVGNDDSFDTLANAVLSGVNVLANDTDLDNSGALGLVDPSTVTQINGSGANVGNFIDLAGGGRARINANGSVTFDPDGDFSHLALGQTATTSFTYQVTDSAGLSDTATATITVTGVNTPPTANPTSGNGAEDQPTRIAIALSGTDTDIGDSIARFNIATLPSNGQLFDAPTGGNALGSGAAITASGDAATVYFQPNPDWNGSTSFNYTAFDGDESSGVATASITVTAAADIADDTATTAEDVPVNVLVLANDDFDGTPAITGTTNGAHGTVSVNNNGTVGDTTDDFVVYTPNANFHGTDSFTYTVTSGGVTETATVDVTVDPVADTPSANSVITNEDTPTVTAIDVTRNAADGVEVTHVKITNILNGTLFLADGTTQVNDGDFLTFAQATGLKFTPTPDFNGNGSFQVQASTSGSDAGLGGGVATSTIVVDAVADTIDDTLSVDEDAAITANVITGTNGASADDFEDTGRTLTAVTQGAHGTVTFLSDGSVTYTPDLDYHGADSFTYTVTAGGATETGTVTVNVAPLADAVDDTLVTDEDTAITANVITGTNGASADSFENVGRAITAVTQGANGSVTFLADGTVTYTPDADYFGPDSFTYTVTSGGATETATVNVTVISQPEPPVFVSLDGTPVFTENGARVVLDDDAAITDADQVGAFDGATLTLERQGGANPDDSFDSFIGSALTLADGQVLLTEPDGLGGFIDVPVGSYVSADGTLAITFNGDATNARVNTVLQNIAYANSSDSPPAAVTIGYTFDNGAPAPATGSITVAINGQNDLPDLENVAPTALFAAGDGPLTLAGGLTITDPDNATLAGATVRITTGLQAASDFLNVDGAVLAATSINVVITPGQIVLSGIDTVANYQQVLASITYVSIADDPAALADTRVIEWTVNDGTNDSVVESTTVYFQPTVDLDAGGAGLDFATAYTEGGAAVPIADTDSRVTGGTFPISASVVLTNAQAGDQLTVGALPGTITAIVDNSVAGQITVSLTGNGLATPDDFEQAIEAVGFSNTGDNPGSTARDVTVTISDSNSSSVVAHTTITVTPVNDAPSGADRTIVALEDTPRVLTAADFGFTDSDGNALASVVISTLPGAGTLTNNGVAVNALDEISIADINAGRLAFQAAAEASGAAYASFTFQVRDDGGTANGGVDLDASANTMTIDVTPVNDAPTAVVLSNVHGPIAENASTTLPIKIADIAVTDIDGGNNLLSLAGADAALFQIIGGDLWLKAGAKLDFETNPRLDVTVRVNDPAVGGPVDAFRSLSIAIVDKPDTINGNGGNETLIGTNSGETLNGLGGNDRILGNGGNDRIIGGTGRDIMTGGPGADLFIFTSLHDSAPGQSGMVNNAAYGTAAGQGVRDIITDFTPGVDRIDLSAIDANIRVAGNQAFVWRGTGNLTVGTPGQLIERIYNAPGTANDRTVIYGDVSGDGRADFQIELSGLKALTAADFVL